MLAIGCVQSRSPVWRRHKQHNRIERRAVEYCTVYLNQCRANGCNTCVYNVYAQCVLVGMPRSRSIPLEGRLMDWCIDCRHGLHLQVNVYVLWVHGLHRSTE